MSLKKCALALTLILSTNLFAKDSEKLKLIPAKTLSEWINSKAPKLALFDANNQKTRVEYGTIPGSTMLKSYNKFDTAELPADKTSKLVFYCANTQCMASHKAADVAISAGFNDVYVMSDGIMGWKKSGYPTQAVSKN